MKLQHHLEVRVSVIAATQELIVLAIVFVSVHLPTVQDVE